MKHQKIVLFVLIIVLFANSSHAEEKPLIINFNGYGHVTQFTCKINDKKELDCHEIKKRMKGHEFFTKLMSRRI